MSNRFLEHGCETMVLKKLEKKLEQIAKAYGCDVTYEESKSSLLTLSESDEETKEKKWMIVFDYHPETGMSIRSFGLNYFDHQINNFPISNIDKDVVDLSQHFDEDDPLSVMRTEVNFISDKTVDVIKLIVEKDLNGLHVELIESRDSTDFSILLSEHFKCSIPAIDDDGFQHYLVTLTNNKWQVSAPEIGTWTQETLYNALIIDYSFADQLLHFTFYNKDAQLVQRSNVAIRKIEVDGDALVFHSVKRNKKIRLNCGKRLSMDVNY